MSQLTYKKTASNNAVVIRWLSDFIVPVFVLCLAVGWLLWQWWTNRLRESFQSEKVPDLTGTPSSTDNTPIKDLKISWTSNYIFSYCHVVLDVFGKKVLVNSLFKTGTDQGLVDNVGYKDSNYGMLTPRIIEEMIKSDKAKAKHISNLVGFMNTDNIMLAEYRSKKIGSGFSKLYAHAKHVILTQNSIATDSDFYIPGDIYFPLDIAISDINNSNIKSLGFDYYLVFHKNIIDSNKPIIKKKWTDNNKGGSLDVSLEYYNNYLLCGYVYNDTIYKTVNKYYDVFGFINEYDGKFISFPKFEKEDNNIKPGTNNNYTEAIVTYNNNEYNYKYFDKTNYKNYGRPFNIQSIDKFKIIPKILDDNPESGNPESGNPESGNPESGDIKFTDQNKIEGFVQKANVISTDPGVSSPANQTIDEVVEYSYSRKIPLGDTFFVKQICIAKLFTFSDPTLSTVSDIRIGIKNNRNNTIQFVGFSERLLGAKGTNYLAAITKRSGPYLVIQDVKTAYGNEISGDEVIIYSKIETGKASPAIDVCITGYPENEKLDYKTLYTDAKLIAGLPPTKKTDGTYPQSLYTDGEVSQTTNADVPSHITTVTLNSYTTTAKTANTPAKITIGEGNTAIDYVSMIYKTVDNPIAPGNGAKLTVLFKNNYSNNSFQVPGPVNQSFIFHKQAPNLFFYKTVIANKFKIYFDKVGNDGNTWHAAAVSARGYTPTSADINRFKLEFNVTDIRGSINPESVCPSMDKFLANQLDSEVILDAMDYNDRINTEQAKLIGQKDNLLTLMEQEEDIARLNRVINRLLDVEKQRSAETNALNTVKFTNQMKEAMKLKEVLEQRIAQRKKNTLDLQFRVNQVVETDQLPTPTTASTTAKEPFEDIPNPTNATNRIRPAMEDDLRIR
jgi:hypothetical protein